MISRLPIISSCALPADILAALVTKGRQAEEECARLIREELGRKYVFLTGSGICAFSLILKALSAGNGRREVVLPAYTAGSLAVAVISSGLRPVLCDISLDDLAIDGASLPSAISENTLAVTAVHPFGLGQRMAGLRAAAGGAVIIEDCAQAMGSLIEGREAGKAGEVSFFSFNRGKNLPFPAGGCIVTDRADIARLLEGETAVLGRPGSTLAQVFRALAFASASNRFFYGAAYPLVRRFKEKSPPAAIAGLRMDPFCAALGARLLPRRQEYFSARSRNGLFLIERLRMCGGVRLPVVPPGDRPVFNRLPVMFEDAGGLRRVERKLWGAGIESSRMYLKPLHHMFGLGYGSGAFPNACYLAEHLLTLPVHPGCTTEDLERMVEVVRRWA
ncbi:MAG: DegT/DnrJ/EryC1/StrS family aminotransferase [Deltaproteobacteria bacterium]